MTPPVFGLGIGAKVSVGASSTMGDGDFTPAGYEAFITSAGEPFLTSDAQDFEVKV